MTRFAFTARLAGIAACIVLPATAKAQSPRAEMTSSWQTTTHIELPGLRLQELPKRVFPTTARPVTTSALAPEKQLAPTGRLTGANHMLNGIASFYWQGQKTATGETFDKMAMTAAHKTLPFNTRVRVTNVANGRSVVVRINDRGPFKAGRVIDLSYAAAGVIEMRDKGLAAVKLEVVK